MGHQTDERIGAGAGLWDIYRARLCPTLDCGLGVADWLFLLAKTFPLLVVFVFCGCATVSERAAPGMSWYEHTTYSESGAAISHTKVTIRQNEDPQSGTTATIGEAGGLEVAWGSSFYRKIASLAHVEKTIAGAGVLCLIAAALLAGIGKHFRLAGLAGLCGLLLFGVAATIDRYAWAYGLGIFLVFLGAGWLAWSSYRGGKMGTVATEVAA